MTKPPPRSMPTTQAQAQRRVVQQHTPGALGGRSASTRPVPPDFAAHTRGIAPGTGGIEVVEHADDETVPRPSATLVMWVGAAFPDNAEDYDFWYPADLS